MNFGIWELVIILVIVALLFGTAKLRNLGGDLGSALKSFRNALKDESDTPATGSGSEKQEQDQAGQDNHRQN